MIDKSYCIMTSKNGLLTILLSILVIVCSAQNIGINNATPDPDAILDITSTDKGVLIPRVSSTQRLAIGGGSPAQGMLVYDVNVKSFFFYNGSSWQDLSEANDTDWTETATEVYTTKRAGVGITSPIRSLDVGGIGTQYSRVTSTSGATTGIEFVRQGGGQDWRWTNSSSFFDLYNVTNDFTSTTLSDIIATFTASGRLGIGTTNPSVELHVDGTIRSDNLAGSGNRPVVANSSGDLIISSTPSTKYWAVNGYSFSSSHPNFNASSIAYINSTTSISFIVAPVNLPHNATVTSVAANFGDISTVSNIRIRLLRLANPGLNTNATLSEIISSGSGSTSQTISDFSITAPTIDNFAYTYMIFVQPASGDTWDFNRINIRNIRISYTQPN